MYVLYIIIYIYYYIYIYNYNIYTHTHLDIYFSPTAQGATTSRWLNSCGTRETRETRDPGPAVIVHRWSLSWIHNNTVVAMRMNSYNTNNDNDNNDDDDDDDDDSSSSSSPTPHWYGAERSPLSQLSQLRSPQVGYISEQSAYHHGEVCPNMSGWRNDNRGRRCVAAMWLVTMVVVISVNH